MIWLMGWLMSCRKYISFYSFLRGIMYHIIFFPVLWEAKIFFLKLKYERFRELSEIDGSITSVSTQHNVIDLYPNVCIWHGFRQEADLSNLMHLLWMSCILRNIYQNNHISHISKILLNFPYCSKWCVIICSWKNTFVPRNVGGKKNLHPGSHNFFKRINLT